MANYRYVILGAGRQGAAAAYDLARFGEAASIRLLDASLAAARRAARRVNRLARKKIAAAGCVDVRRRKALVQALRGHDAGLGAVPYPFNVALTRAAISARVPLCDLGGNTKIVFEQLALNAQARKAGVAVVPDCGLAPGAANVLAVHAMERIEALGAKPEEVKLYCGGLPRHPHPPLDYQLVFSLEGLLNEYEGQAVVLRRGKRVKVDTLAEVETLNFPKPLGRCEAFTTSGGASTAPWTFRGKLQTYEYKTVRYPGHCARMRAIRELGLFDRKCVRAPVRKGRGSQIELKKVSPRDVFKAAVTPKLSFPGEHDVVLLRGAAKSRARGRGGNRKRIEFRMDWLDFHDPKSGFSAMERTTGFSASIVAILLAQGAIRPGVSTPERAVPAGAFVRALKQRGFSLKERVRLRRT